LFIFLSAKVFNFDERSSTRFPISPNNRVQEMPSSRQVVLLTLRAYDPLSGKKLTAPVVASPISSPVSFGER
jgi:hypothetical protein